ncbi:MULTISPECIES: DUF4244 domain-containing protein [unclassified Schaalia]|uniref:DUF4244 domain-containing protein n=1 Tax=unclassified Schaalia TaxID=2691889 RepID=UPI001E303AA4|nr:MULTISPECIES: DUF4244 domain-containing protein [unclassified Schaalia]MCD4548836.1 DUF4244 domain-containing protein [Schaalia sp. lx-260]MCD4557452.1 DUF4244 domain-containing protein [Schaalia sp. lx-100]
MSRNLKANQKEELTDNGSESGSTTVEYAIGALAAAGFAMLLMVVLKSGFVQHLLEGIIEKALTL